MIPNPYTPGAGMVPRYLAGRDDTIADARKTLVALSYGMPTRSVIFYGLCGVGKTVLLNKIEEIAEELNILHEHIEISERSSFKSGISFYARKLITQISTKEQAKHYLNKALSVLKAFQITYSEDGITFGMKDDVEVAVGVSDTGNFQNDLTELFVAIGVLAQKNERAVCLFIDEIQNLQEDEFEALIAAIHRINQKGLPVALFGAGLPRVAKLAGDIKSYAERLFNFVSIGSLSEPAARLALEEPAKKFNVLYTKDAVDEIIKITAGYPYFLQEYGKQVWDSRRDDLIAIGSVLEARGGFVKSLDEGFFKVRYDRATPKEREFMMAMVAFGKLPCTMSQIATVMETSVSSLSPLRAQLIYKGFIYPPGHGEVDFTVPQFKQYLLRAQNNFNHGQLRYPGQVGLINP